MTDKKIIAVVGATGAQGGGLSNAILDEPNGQFALRALMLPGIASEDIGRTAFGIFERGTELVGRTVHISGENLSGDEYATVVSKELGEDVVHRPMSWTPCAGCRSRAPRTPRTCSSSTPSTRTRSPAPATRTMSGSESVAAGLRHLAGRQSRQFHGC